MPVKLLTGPKLGSDEWLGATGWIPFSKSYTPWDAVKEGPFPHLVGWWPSLPPASGWCSMIIPSQVSLTGSITLSELTHVGTKFSLGHQREKDVQVTSYILFVDAQQEARIFEITLPEKCPFFRISLSSAKWPTRATECPGVAQPLG